MKKCGFCSFQTDDEALFADHVYVAHGWGTTRGPDTAALQSRHCYHCGARSPSSAATCATCGRALEPTEAQRRSGTAFALNELLSWIRAGLVDGPTAERLRRHLSAALAAPPDRAERAPAPVSPSPIAEPARAVPPPPVVAPTRPREPSPPGLLSPERAPSLLLYVGAFLIVVAALIFVNVSREQISGAAKLSLLALGTLGFIGVGLVCHRSPRVIEAGRTFLAIGALLVPLDFLAYWVLITSAVVAPAATWTSGAVVSAGLYATLAMMRFGRLYAYLFLPAALAAVAGIEWLFAVPAEWIPLPVAVVPMALEALRTWRRNERVELLAAPLQTPGQVIVAITLVVSAWIVLLGEAFSADRRVLPATFAVAAMYYGARARDGGSLERWTAVLAPCAFALAVVYSLRGGQQTYGFVLTLLAFAYGVAGDAFAAGTPIPLPAWLRDAAWRVALASAVIALLPVDAYWRAPFVGGTVDVAVGVGLAAAVVRQAPRRTDLLPVLLVIAVVAVHVGELLLLVASGVIQSGAAPYTGLIGREIGIAIAPLAVLLGAAAWLARTRLPQLRREIFVLALGSAAAMLLFAFESPPVATILALASGSLLIAAAVASRVPSVLWIAAGAFGVALVSLDRWVLPPHEARPLALAALALAIFVPAGLPRWRSASFAPTVREIGLATGAAAMFVGLLTALITPIPRGSDVFSLAVWLATVPAVLVYGAIGVADGMIRRRESEVLGSTAFFLAAVLMVVPRFHPDPVEAYTLPIAAYFALVAWGLARWRPRLRTALEAPARIAAALALILPTYVYSWRGDDTLRGVIALAESILVLAVAARLEDSELSLTAIGSLAIMAARAVASPLAFEAATAAFGAVAIAFALGLPRIAARRARALSLEYLEIVGGVLIVLPPLVRASLRGADALDHGAAVLAAAAVLVAVALVSGRATILVTGLAAAAATAILALPESERAEPYVVVTGLVLLVLSLAVGRVLPRRLPEAYELALDLTAGGLILSSATQRMLSTGGDASIRVVVESLGLVALGIAAARPALAYAGLVGSALLGAWVSVDVDRREFHGIATGASLVALALYASRYAPKVLDASALLAMESGGALLFMGPTLIAGWGSDFFPRTPALFFEILLVLGAGVALHRRWLVGAALAALGLETIRALIDAVNRLPNYVLFAASGALLLGVGFVLLLKREAWREWSARVITWWARL